MKEPVKIGGKRVCYTAVESGLGRKPWGIGTVKEDEAGYHPVADLGEFVTFDDAMKRAQRYNDRIHVTVEIAREIVASSMRAQRKTERRAKPAKKQQRRGSDA